MPKTPSKRKKQAKPEDLQMFAITFLLCAPTDLQAAWLSGERDNWKKALKDLKHLKDPERALQLLDELEPRQPFFEGLGSLLTETSEYTLDPPHPALPTAQILLERLK